MNLNPLLGRTIKQTVTSDAIRHDLDRFLTRRSWQETPSLFSTMWLGVAILMVSLGFFQLLAGYVTGFVLFLLAAATVAAVSHYGLKVWAIRTRTGLWDKSTLQVISDLVGEVYGDAPGADREYLGKSATLLALLASAPTYIGEDARYEYWSDTLEELRQHAEASRALRGITEKRKAAQARLAAVQGEVPPTSTKRWGILPAPPVAEDPLVRTARVQLSEIDTTHHDLTTYLERLVENITARRRELGRAIAATELYLDIPSEAVLLPPLPAVEPLPHVEAVRTLVS